MWLPRLRFTLVPHSSRSPFRRVLVFFFPLFVCLGVFCKFFSTKVQLHLCFSQAQRVQDRSEGYCPFLSQYLPRSRYPRSDQGEGIHRAVPSGHRGRRRAQPCPERRRRAEGRAVSRHEGPRERSSASHASSGTLPLPNQKVICDWLD